MKGNSVVTFAKRLAAQRSAQSQSKRARITPDKVPSRQVAVHKPVALPYNAANTLFICRNSLPLLRSTATLIKRIVCDGRSPDAITMLSPHWQGADPHPDWPESNQLVNDQTRTEVGCLRSYAALTRCFFRAGSTAVIATAQRNTHMLMRAFLFMVGIDYRPSVSSCWRVQVGAVRGF